MLGAIWAQSLDNIIGDGNTMPWILPEDLTHFKEKTTNNLDTAYHESINPSVFMGRKTWDSLPPQYKPLPNRENYILSTQKPGTWSHNAHVHNDYNDFINTMNTRCKQSSPCFIIGGGKIYEKTLPLVDFVEMTIVNKTLGNILGDKAVYAPQLTQDFDIVTDTGWLFSKNGTLNHENNQEKPLSYKFLRYERK